MLRTIEFSTDPTSIDIQFPLDVRVYLTDDSLVIEITNGLGLESSEEHTYEDLKIKVEEIPSDED